MQYRYGILLGFLLLLPGLAFSQLQFGVRSDNYAGVLSANLNPAFSAFSPFRWDVHVGGVAHFSENNYGYLQDVGVPDLLRQTSNPNFDFGPTLRKENLLPNGIVLDFFEDNRERYFYTSSTISLPSVSYKINEQHTVGLILQSRLVAGMDNVSDNFSYYTFNTRAAYDTFPVPPAYGGALAWTEIGLHYAWSKQVKSGMLALGVTAKYLAGHEGGYFYTLDRFRMARLPQNGLAGTPVAMQFAYTNTAFTDDSYQPTLNGTGIGMDIGLAYKIDGDAAGYAWKLGLAVLDLGAIQFNQAAFRHEINLEAPGTLDGNSYRFFDSPGDANAVIDTFTMQLTGTPGGSLVENAFTQWLPTRLSFQIDHRINESFFVGAMLIQPLRLNETAILGGSLFTIAPRYERYLFSASLPISSYQWDGWRMGLALRMGPLYLGTEKLASFGKQAKFTGTDFYIGLRVSPWLFSRNAALLSAGGKRNGSACPKF